MLGLAYLFTIVVAAVAIWMLVDRFVENENVKFVLRVVGGAILIIMCIRLLARFVGP